MNAAGVRACRATAADAKYVVDHLRDLEKLYAKLHGVKAAQAIMAAYAVALEVWSIWDLKTEELLAVVGVGGELHLGDCVVPMAWCVGTDAFDAALKRSPRKSLAAFKAMLKMLNERYGCVGNLMPNKRAFQGAANILTACGAKWFNSGASWVWLSNPEGVAS